MPKKNQQPDEQQTLVAVYLRNTPIETRERLHRIAGANALTLAQAVERLICLHDATRSKAYGAEGGSVVDFASTTLEECGLDY